MNIDVIIVMKVKSLIKFAVGQAPQALLWVGVTKNFHQSLNTKQLDTVVL